MVRRSIAFSILTLLCAVAASERTLADESQSSASSASSTQEARLGIGVSPLPKLQKSSARSDRRWPRDLDF